MRRTVRLLARLTLAAAAVSVAPAAADARVPPANTLDRTRTTAHVIVHFRNADFASATAADTWAQAASTGLEAAYSRLVTGGGGTPNAGMRVPVDDGDGKTDFYASPPSNDPVMAGASGLAYVEPNVLSGSSGYIFVKPSLSTTAVKAVAAHEFTHVVSFAYNEGYGPHFMEAIAEWGEEYSLPDVDPLSNNFGSSSSGPAPWTPLSCSYGLYAGYAGESRDCSGGYWQWLYLQRLVEAYGPAVIRGYLERHHVSCNSGGGCTSAQDLDLLDAELAPRGTSMGQRFRSYARDVWVPSRWATTAVGTITGSIGPPAASTITGAQSDVGPSTQEVDDLATRYLRIRTAGATAATGPDDVARVTLTRPAGVGVQQTLTRDRNGVWTDGVSFDGGAGVAQVRNLVFDAARVRDVVVPLTNDTRTVDKQLTWRVQIVRGAPRPPANDTQAGAAAVSLGVRATTDSVYAGGAGATEAVGCASALGATNGVWFRFTTLANGTYRYSATASGYGTVVSLRNASTGAFGGCSATGSISATQAAGTTYDVYVGRRGDAADAPGTTAALDVTGPSAPPPPITPTPAPAPQPTTPPAPSIPTTGGSARPDVVAVPRVSIALVARQRLLTVLRRGLRTTCTANLPGRCTVSVWVSARTARKYGITVPRGARQVRVARGGDRAVHLPGARTVTAKVSKTAATRLRRAQRLPVMLRAVLVSSAGDAQASKPVTLRR